MDMDILEILRKDHKDVADLFKQIEKAFDGDERLPADAVEQLKHSLEAHAHGEEEVFYPALKSAQETRFETLEALVEHRALKERLAEMDSAGQGDDEWWASFHVLKEYVE